MKREEGLVVLLCLVSPVATQERLCKLPSCDHLAHLVSESLCTFKPGLKVWEGLLMAA